MKPRIFIGSSTEGLKVAHVVKEHLANEFECYLWTDGIFKYNHTPLETLLADVKTFEYGILIATKDDKIDSRKNVFETPRDNVVFEFGMFLSALGKERAFVLQEEGAKLPSDLLGVTVPRFTKTKTPGKSASLKSEIERIGKRIMEDNNHARLGWLPSTALGIAYFKSFVFEVCISYGNKAGPILAGKRNFKSFILNIVVPRELDQDMLDTSAVFFKNRRFGETSIGTPNRPISVFF